MERRRLAVLGGATILVVAGHSYLVAPFFDFARLGWAEFLVRAAGIGVVAVLAAVGAGAVHQVQVSPRTQLARLVAFAIRLWAASAAAVLMVALSRAFDPTDERPALGGESVLRLATFSWNSFVAQNPLVVAPELSMLWVFSVAIQLSVLIGVVTLVLRRRPVLIAATLVGGATLATAWGWQLGENEGAFVVTLDTWAAGSALLWGGCGALLAERLAQRRMQRFIVAAAGGALIVAVVAVSELPVAAAWTGVNTVVALCVGWLVGGAGPARRGPVWVVELGLGAIGRRWYLVIALCAPVLSIIGRHLPTADPVTFALAWIALAVVALGVPDVIGPVVADRLDAVRARRRRAARSAVEQRRQELTHAGEKTP